MNTDKLSIPAIYKIAEDIENAGAVQVISDHISNGARFLSKRGRDAIVDGLKLLAKERENA